MTTDTPALEIEVETPYGALTLIAKRRNHIVARAEDLRINNVHYQLTQSMYLHPEGTRTGKMDTSGWQNFEVGDWNGEFYMRRVERKANSTSIYDDYPTSAAREKAIAALQEACKQMPVELLERAEVADVESDIRAREAQIAAAEEFIGHMRAEIELFRAGGREEYRSREYSSGKRKTIVMPNGELHDTRNASFSVNR